MAAEQLESYVAVLSERDHYSSKGERLTTAAEIVRQDRANYHRFGKRDDGDGDDAYFADAHNRDVLERLLNAGNAEPGIREEIVDNVCRVRVDVYRSGNGDYVVVTVLDRRLLN